MKDRIQQFIDYKGISAGDLATALDVQRSNISHILNGRNKPGASFIEKFLLTYPELNARWLLTGQGNMIQSDAFESNQETPTQQKEPQPPESDSAAKQPKKVPSGVPSYQKETTTGDKVEKLILLNSNGTFKVYNPEN